MNEGCGFAYEAVWHVLQYVFIACYVYVTSASGHNFSKWIALLL